ncbi:MULTISPECIES: TonB-dependent receptor domain-containing protein [unclassified Duganella]|uniref:TonB-dependent receptor domain-containing protein n=1 Tax=unclassified Duganella TaxID=2636909 RepID=UPI00088588F3|nr:MULTISPECIES: TonB-dependent receptor [unclassified Duganella]SDH04018.1 iron complex outermembrane recepter protein [Duganella sp. OV458]SDK22054.1 iron complex outermembrane recepter protein [Duganella sp. OV510]
MNNIALKASVIAVGLTLGSSYAQDAPMEKVIITGSNIKRIDVETATPVQVLRREEITRLGVNSVRDIIDTLTSSDSSALSDIGGSNSFASGASSASLRNLGKQSTLVLLNSRRVAPYALADYNEVFTNLDSLPLDAIERVEILRNGGSAIYGSDAVAGVINIITRNDFQGVQLRANYQQSLKNEQFKTRTASLTGGFGDYQKDGYNVLANIEVFKRDSVIWRDVLDDINPAYGDKFSAVAPGSGAMFGHRGAPSTFSYPGNLIGQGPVTGCTTLNAAGLCVYDRFAQFEAVPKAERVSALVSGKLKLSEQVEAYSEVLYSKTKTNYISAPGTYGSTNPDTVWGNPATGAGKLFGYRFLSPDSPLNTTGEPLELRYRYADAPRGNPNDSDQYRALAGLRGTLSERWDWDTAVGVMGSKTWSRNNGALSDSGFKAVVGDYTRTLAGDPNCEANFPGYCEYTAADPNFFNGLYKLGQQNSPEVLRQLFPEQGYDGKITQYFIDGKISGEIGKIGERAIALAVGGEVRHEKFKITPTSNLANGDIVGYGAASADASRTTEAVFTEVNLPVTDKLELVGAARIDKFPGFKAHASPKVAARWEVTPAFMLRSTYEGGFRAPNLTESAQSSKFAFDNGVTDPKRCNQARALARDLRTAANALPDSDPNQALQLARADIVEQNECAAGVASVVRNNPGLKPETTRSATVGFVLEPVKGSNLSLDYWHIERKDEIGLKSTDDLLASEADQPEGVITRGALASDKTFTAAERAQYGVTTGPLLSTSGRFENVSRTKTSGIDLSANTRFDTGIGRVDLGLNATRLLQLKNFSSTRNDYGDNLAGRYSYPKTVANLTSTLRTGAFSNGLRLVYQSKTSLHGDFFDEVYTDQGCVDLEWNASECQVKAYGRLDYTFSYSGIKDLTLSLYVRNITNRRPPLDLREFSEQGGVIPQNIADVQGRSVRVTAEYRFR